MDQLVRKDGILQYNDSDGVESLSALDIDIEALEQRIEMSSLLHPMSYTCAGDAGTVCGANGCGTNTSPTPSPKPNALFSFFGLLN